METVTTIEQNLALAKGALSAAGPPRRSGRGKSGPIPIHAVAR